MAEPKSFPALERLIECHAAIGPASGIAAPSPIVEQARRELRDLDLAVLEGREDEHVACCMVHIWNKSWTHPCGCKCGCKYICPRLANLQKQKADLSKT